MSIHSTKNHHSHSSSSTYNTRQRASKNISITIIHKYISLRDLKALVQFNQKKKKKRLYTKKKQRNTFRSYTPSSAGHSAKTPASSLATIHSTATGQPQPTNKSAKPPASDHRKLPHPAVPKPVETPCQPGPLTGRRGR